VRIFGLRYRIYFKPKEYLEQEIDIEKYPGEKRTWSDLVDTLRTDDVDLVALNRARPALIYTVLRDGLFLIIRDKGSFLIFFAKQVMK